MDILLIDADDVMRHAIGSILLDAGHRVLARPFERAAPPNLADRVAETSARQMTSHWSVCA